MLNKGKYYRLITERDMPETGKCKQRTRREQTGIKQSEKMDKNCKEYTFRMRKNLEIP